MLSKFGWPGQNRHLTDILLTSESPVRVAGSKALKGEPSRHPCKAWEAKMTFESNSPFDMLMFIASQALIETFNSFVRTARRGSLFQPLLWFSSHLFAASQLHQLQFLNSFTKKRRSIVLWLYFDSAIYGKASNAAVAWSSEVRFKKSRTSQNAMQTRVHLRWPSTRIWTPLTTKPGARVLLPEMHCATLSQREKENPLMNLSAHVELCNVHVLTNTYWWNALNYIFRAQKAQNLIAVPFFMLA